MTDLEWPGILDEDDAVEYTLAIYGDGHDHDKIFEIIEDAIGRIEKLTGTDVLAMARVTRGDDTP